MVGREGRRVWVCGGVDILDEKDGVFLGGFGFGFRFLRNIKIDKKKQQ